MYIAKSFLYSFFHPKCSIQSLLPLTHLSFSAMVFKLAFLTIPEYIKCYIIKINKIITSVNFPFIPLRYYAGTKYL